MSLRSFHIFFIATALGLLMFSTYWSGVRLLRGEDGQLWAMALSSGAGLLIGFTYLGWFLRKYR